MWLKDAVYLQCKKHMFRPIAVISGFVSFLAKRVLYNMPKPRGDIKISPSFYVLLLSLLWWDVCCVNEFVANWVWIFPFGWV